MSPPPKSPRNAEPTNFESAMQELEKIVSRMEGGDLSLEQSLEAHRRGLELAQYCQGLLAQAQQQVKVLEENSLRTLSGLAGAEDDDAGDDDDD